MTAGTNEATKSLRPANEGNLRDDAFHAPVNRGNDQHMGAAVARSPNPDARRVGLLEVQRERDRIRIVPDLEPGVDFLPWLAVARPENTASRRVMEKIGMKYDGIGRYYDCDLAHYSITRENYNR